MTAKQVSASTQLEGVTLEQLRVLIAVADEGSFSAAARRLGRVQSAVSQLMASLEKLVDYKIWDRSERSVSLTDRGKTLVVAARDVLAEVERLREVSEALRAGRTERLSLCVDAIFPAKGLVSLASALRAAFPGISLRLDTDTLASVSARVARREADVGIAGPVGSFDFLERVAVGSVLMIPVAAPGHRLADIRGRITTDLIAPKPRLSSSERGNPESPDQAVLSEQNWRVADLSTKRVLFLAV
ncbi:MAG: LysR family transcriptional regulator [Polyangiaceae bacterium]